MAGRRSPETDTRTRILDVAERLVQQRGFNGFSYSDVAQELKVTTASLHYHYPGKAELGRALIERYSSRFAEALQRIDATAAEVPAKVAAYIELYAGVVREGRLCLCGMLAAEYRTLPGLMRTSVLRFFDDNEAWLARLLEQGRSGGQLHFAGSPEAAARAIVSGLEGAMLVAGPYDDVARFESVATRLLESLAVKDLT